MIWLAVAALVAACMVLDRRHARHVARLNERRRVLRLPGQKVAG